jgi:hypothetical protein
VKRLFSIFTGLVLLGVSHPAWVHHSGAMFDRTTTKVITGTVVEFTWTNPHASFKVEVTGASGQPEIWAIEMNSPNNLVREGWKRTSIKAGDKVSVTINPLRDGRPGGWYVSILLADGRRLGGTAPAPSSASDAKEPQT